MFLPIKKKSVLIYKLGTKQTLDKNPMETNRSCHKKSFYSKNVESSPQTVILNTEFAV